MKSDQPQLGKIIEGDAYRDAVHIAVFPAVAWEDLEPSCHVGPIEPGSDKFGGMFHGQVGIVDPFLRQTVKRGERFYVFLYPNTVTGLRHVWTHPAFTTKLPERT